MPTYQRPGVFVDATLEALTTNNVGIPGSSIATFAGAYPQGPLTPTLIGSWGQFQLMYGGFATAPGNLLPFAVNQFFANGGGSCLVCRIPNSDAVAAALELQDINTPPDNVLSISANSPGVWGNSVYIGIASAGVSGRVNFTVYSGGTTTSNIVETFNSLSMNPADNRYIQSVINSPISGSNFVTCLVTLPNNTYSAGVTDLALISPTPLSGGTNGSVSPNLSVAIPNQLDTIQQQIMSVNLPGVTDPTTLNTILDWAEGRGDVMLVIDGPAPTTGEKSSDVANYYVNMVSGSNIIEATPYAALYAPWLLIQDPSSSINGATRWVPPGGQILGAWDSTDAKVGPWQTPAGVTFGGLNCVDLEVNFTANDLNTLNSNQINALKKIPGQGFCIFGGETLQPGFTSQNISDQREIIQLTHDFTVLTQFAIFEQNGPALWQRIVTVLTTYLTQQMQLGVFFGTTPDQAFTVICDSSNNTPSTAMAGIVNIQVGVALVSPAQFILINIQQFTAGTTSTTVSA